jgi:phosphoglycolate phosphatase-like HAD superfamily hydrolase
MIGKIRIAILLAAGALSTVAASASDPLPSWREGAAKAAIIEFVAGVTRRDGPTYSPPAARIAVFDNDGTLWAEQPAYFQLLFAVDRIKALAPQRPEWKEKEPYASILKGDVKRALASGEHALQEILAATHAGSTTDEFDAVVKEWLATARHPRFKRPYTDIVYQPMLELLRYLRENEFRTFIVSGGGVEFLRAFAEETYGIPPEQVIGSSGKQKFELRDGKPVLVKLPAVDFVDDKEGKPINIQKIIGRRPLAAFGNSDGDLAMLQWTCSGEGARLCLFVHHTDAEREWAYDRQSHIGRLDKGLEQAQRDGWIVVSMRTDWRRIFPF